MAGANISNRFSPADNSDHITVQAAGPECMVRETEPAPADGRVTLTFRGSEPTAFAVSVRIVSSQPFQSLAVSAEPEPEAGQAGLGPTFAAEAAADLYPADSFQRLIRIVAGVPTEHMPHSVSVAAGLADVQMPFGGGALRAEGLTVVRKMPGRTGPVVLEFAGPGALSLSHVVGGASADVGGGHRTGDRRVAALRPPVRQGGDKNIVGGGRGCRGGAESRGRPATGAIERPARAHLFLGPSTTTEARQR